MVWLRACIFGGLCGVGCIVYSCGGWVGGDVFSCQGAVAFGVILGDGRVCLSCFFPCWLVREMCVLELIMGVVLCPVG